MSRPRTNDKFDTTETESVAAPAPDVFEPYREALRRNAHGVIDVASTIHSYAIGTLEAVPEHIEPLAAWLEWRVTEGWFSGPNNDRVFDDLVATFVCGACNFVPNIARYWRAHKQRRLEREIANRVPAARVVRKGKS